MVLLLTSACSEQQCIKGDCNNGYGTKVFKDGYNTNKYVGEWKDGKQHGQGIFTFANGDKYVGEWKDGKEHGQGTDTWADGSKYVGEYKDGLEHGQGTFTYADGDKYVGEFKDGKLIKSKEKLMKKYDTFQSLDIEMKMKVAPLGLDFACYNACKERNVEAFCRIKCSIQ